MGSCLLRLVWGLLQLTVVVGALLAFIHDNYSRLDTVKELERPLNKNVVLEHIKILESPPFSLKYPWVVMAQEVHETNWFKSPVYREGHNRFGMKVNSRRYHQGAHRGHAKYKDFKSSVLDYRDWQRMRLKQNPWVKSEDDYIDMLIKVKYAEDRKYRERIIETKNKLRELAALPR